ncbi:chorismate mutase [Clostridium cellulovorans]|uniref:Chorismate mutase, type II n=1 Tax=Clostridium cellulovorans (strain ATCC 35296 / DSM 3052 / OCM 3 / 743B) TaxID=573061 RepID=D9SQC1_CLOC7|nr:chorismate mutase [Clostridium cellulovorans]ADL50188.1 Chorismate mutase, type II [Clostridium cellulovorans 743B]
MILIITNNDERTNSFVECIKKVAKTEVKIIQDKEVSIEKISKLQPDSIIISLKYKKDLETGSFKEILEKYKSVIPILGVAGGYAIIAEYFGCEIVELNNNNDALITCDTNEELFKDFPLSFNAMGGQSIYINKDKLVDQVISIAFSEESAQIEAIKHRNYPVYGVRFYPDFINNNDDLIIIRNFLSINDKICLDDSEIIKVKMGQIRKNIDEIDRKIVRLLSKRNANVKEASKYKKTSSDVVAEDRIKDVLQKVRTIASAEEIDPDLVVRIYEFIIRSFIAYEMSEFEKNKK